MECKLPSISLGGISLEQQYNLEFQYPLYQEEIIQVCQPLAGKNILLLVDTETTLAPFRRFIENICNAIASVGNAVKYYFNHTPVNSADRAVLSKSPDVFFPVLDSVLDEIIPQVEGHLLVPGGEFIKMVETKEVLDLYAKEAVVLVISDFGAAKGDYDLYRMLDTVAFSKALDEYTRQYVCFNPFPEGQWRNSETSRNNNTATQISRYVSMFSLDRTGLAKAMDVLKNKEESI
jgi:hypothetical protein